MSGSIRELGVLHARRAPVFARCTSLSGIGAAMGQMKELAYLDGQIAKLWEDIAKREPANAGYGVTEGSQAVVATMIARIFVDQG